VVDGEDLHPGVVEIMRLRLMPGGTWLTQLVFELLFIEL
jgi:hypothetical protein